MDKKPHTVKAYNLDDVVGELVRERCTAISTQAQRELDALGKRVAALEARCHEMVCELAETCVQSYCRSRVPHPPRDNCKQSCCSQPGDRGRCIPVPASPEVAIPDVPTPVGTEAFRRELTGHMQTLAQAYSWDADSLPVWGGHDYLERLAGVACAIRDAYDLARTGEAEAAMQKLEEIEW